MADAIRSPVFNVVREHLDAHPGDTLDQTWEVLKHNAMFTQYKNPRESVRRAYEDVREEARV